MTKLKQQPVFVLRDADILVKVTILPLCNAGMQ